MGFDFSEVFDAVDDLLHGVAAAAAPDALGEGFAGGGLGFLVGFGGLGLGEAEELVLGHPWRCGDFVDDGFGFCFLGA